MDGSGCSPRWWATNPPTVLYNKDQDRYITVIRGVGEPIVTSGAEHRAICEAYFQHGWEELHVERDRARLRHARAWLIQYLHIHGITHDKEPFSARS